MKKMNAAEVNKISKEAQEEIQRDAEKTIEMRILAAAKEGNTQVKIEWGKVQAIYYAIGGHYEQELIGRGFVVTHNDSSKTYVISWENAK